MPLIKNPVIATVRGSNFFILRTSIRFAGSLAGETMISTHHAIPNPATCLTF